MSIYLISDTHFGHAKIIEYAQRPFADVTEQDRILIDNWRQMLTEEDTTFHLGDVALGRNKAWIRLTLESIPGKKVLILGNHDRDHSVKWWLEAGFDEVYPYPIILDGFWMLSHEPLFVNTAMPYVNIHGHTHQTSSDNPQQVNISVEKMAYAPVLFDEIKAFFKPETLPDLSDRDPCDGSPGKPGVFLSKFPTRALIPCDGCKACRRPSALSRILENLDRLEEDAKGKKP